MSCALSALPTRCQAVPAQQGRPKRSAPAQRPRAPPLSAASSSGAGTDRSGFTPDTDSLQSLGDLGDAAALEAAKTEKKGGIEEFGKAVRSFFGGGGSGGGGGSSNSGGGSGREEARERELLGLALYGMALLYDANEKAQERLLAAAHGQQQCSTSALVEAARERGAKEAAQQEAARERAAKEAAQEEAACQRDAKDKLQERLRAALQQVAVLRRRLQGGTAAAPATQVQLCGLLCYALAQLHAACAEGVGERGAKGKAEQELPSG